ncbi:UDP-glucose flavonoid 3-O-glucosyltransferase 6-like [Hibiscus syriacus]|uniref:UDP-glucose flavonoid 3-O-glucosyltransferase 6-like n=1 Tax=Hibiscus syriacus TaxID=106335 RepID=A0A6A3BIS1_HIBSY|nr:UDP-glucose flavonoid 3-O-glucosyltransferase 6-like [Hibiscus syriacus]
MIVTPSSPTANGLRRYQLSFLDQLNPSLYNFLIYFYPKICDTDADKSTISDRLKRSISGALTYFYPLGGRITEDQLFVDCNDEGTPFVEARVKCQLSDVLNNPVPKELNKLLPFEIHGDHKILIGIKLYVFEGGGIGIGVCVSHKIRDALSFFSFVKTWAAIALEDRTTCNEEIRVWCHQSGGNQKKIFRTTPSMEESNLVSQMRDSIKAVNNEYVKKLQHGYNHLDCFKEKAASYGKCDIVAFTLTSLCRFPLYEADFGWGKPIWACSGDREINSIATFMDTITGDGMEAWITLKEEEMAKFDSYSYEVLLAYVYPPKSL